MSSTTDTSGIAKYIFEYKKSSVSTWTTALEQATRPSEYKFTGLEANTSYDFRVITIDNAGNTGTGTSKNQTTEASNDLMNPNINTTYGGLTVDYTPKAGQVYNTEGKNSTTSSGSDEYSGSSFQYFQTSDLPAGWQVWGTDDNYIYIISTKPTSKYLKLSSYTGYNNGVTLLDSICDNVYTDKTKYSGTKGQNLKVEQILAVRDPSSETTGEVNGFGKTVYSLDCSVPTVWVKYEQDIATTIANKSKAYGYVAPEDSTGQQPYKGNGTSNAHYMAYSKPLPTMFMATYKDLILSSDEEFRYWLSSRFCWITTNSDAKWGLSHVYHGIDEATCWYKQKYSYSKPSYDNLPIRPIISFPTSMYRLDTSTTPAKIVKR